MKIRCAHWKPSMMSKCHDLIGIVCYIKLSLYFSYSHVVSAALFPLFVIVIFNIVWDVLEIFSCFHDFKPQTCSKIVTCTTKIQIKFLNWNDTAVTLFCFPYLNTLMLTNKNLLNRCFVSNQLQFSHIDSKHYLTSRTPYCYKKILIFHLSIDNHTIMNFFFKLLQVNVALIFKQRRYVQKQ